MRDTVALVLAVVLVLSMVITALGSGDLYTPGRDEISFDVIGGAGRIMVVVRLSRAGGLAVEVKSIRVQGENVDIDLAVYRSSGRATSSLVIPVTGLTPGKYTVVIRVNGEVFHKSHVFVRGGRPWVTRGGWTLISNGYITVAIPSGRTVPVYVWWYNGDNKTVYVADYMGIAEVWLGRGEHFRHSRIYSNPEASLNWISSKISKLNYTWRDLRDLKASINKVVMEVVSHPLDAGSAVNKSLQDVNSILKSELPGNIREILLKIRSVLLNLSREIGKLRHCRPSERAAIVKEISKLASTLRKLSLKLEEEWVAVSRSVAEMRGKLMWLRGRMHPFYMPFVAGEWRLDGPVEVGDGVEFNFTLVRAPEPFRFLENNLVIKNVIHVATTNASEMGWLKNEIVVRRWRWNNAEVIRLLGRNVQSILRYGVALVLRVDLHMARLAGNASFSSALNMSSGMRYVELICGGRVVDPVKSVEDDLHIRGYGLIKIVNRETMIAGFYKFVPKATIIYPNGSSATVNVTATFLSVGGRVSLYMIYPSFGDGALIHDPYKGVQVNGIGQQQTAPAVPSPSETTSTGTAETQRPTGGGSAGEVATSTQSLKYAPSREERIAVLVLLTLLAMVVATLYRRRT